MDINARRKIAEVSGTNDVSGTDNDRATPNLGFNPGDLAVAITPAKGARRRRRQDISCTEATPRRMLGTWHPERRFATVAAAHN
jgi:hypothetical protein